MSPLSRRAASSWSTTTARAACTSSAGTSARVGKLEPAPTTSAPGLTQADSNTGVALFVIVTTTSAPRTAASGDSAATPPTSAANRWRRSDVRLNTRSSAMSSASWSAATWVRACQPAPITATVLGPGGASLRTATPVAAPVRNAPSRSASISAIGSPPRSYSTTRKRALPPPTVYDFRPDTPPAGQLANITFNTPPGGKTRRRGWFCASPLPRSVMAASTAPITVPTSPRRPTSASRSRSAMAERIAGMHGMERTALQIGLIGIGTVGAEVADRLLNRRGTLRRRAGVDLLLKRVLVRDTDRQRGIEVPAGLLTMDASALLDDPDVDVVVEVAGGDEPARTFLERAIRSGKHVVTANKVVMARHGPELLELAGEMNVDVYFEAAVGGGIPLISTFKVDLLANDIQRILAVINGTTNYVLGRMANEGLTLPEAVAEAQAAGYAEADPTEDVGGFDAAYKLAIMASLGFGARVHPGQVYRGGIEGIEPVDFKYSRELGYEVKLLAYAARAEGGRAEARVHPVLVPHGHPLAAVDGPANAVYIEGDL